MITGLVKKKRKRKRARTQPAGQALAPEPLSPLLALTLSGEREKGERRERPRHKPGGVPPEGDEPTGHKDESQ